MAITMIREIVRPVMIRLALKPFKICIFSNTCT